MSSRTGAAAGTERALRPNGLLVLCNLSRLPACSAQLMQLKRRMSPFSFSLRLLFSSRFLFSWIKWVNFYFQKVDCLRCRFLIRALVRPLTLRFSSGCGHMFVFVVLRVKASNELEWYSTRSINTLSSCTLFFFLLITIHFELWIHFV